MGVRAQGGRTARVVPAQGLNHCLFPGLNRLRFRRAAARAFAHRLRPRTLLQFPLVQALWRVAIHATVRLAARDRAGALSVAFLLRDAHAIAGGLSTAKRTKARRRRARKKWRQILGAWLDPSVFRRIAGNRFRTVKFTVQGCLGADPLLQGAGRPLGVLR